MGRPQELSDAEVFVKSQLSERVFNINKKKCYEILNSCKKEINKIVKECEGKDGNSAFLALELIRDIDRLQMCISIDK